MNPRYLIPFLCVGAVAFACGPRSHNEASGTRKAKSTTVDRPATHAPVAAQLSVRHDGNAVRLALQVVNTSRKRIELTFPTGQTYDFVVLDSVGRELWRWAEGRMFTQTLRNKLLDGGETFALEETLDAARLAPGTYTARALLTSQNYPLAQQTTFTVPPVVASR